MSYIPEEVITEIREQVNIVDLVNQYVTLTKRGTNYMSSCPFHEDRNPSFSVSEKKQIFKCFSCGRGGNIFSFLQEIEGLTFPESVVKAAEFGNVAIPDSYLSSGSRGSQGPNLDYLYEIHERVTGFYQYYLMNTQNGEQTLQYLLRRNLSEEMIETFQLGLAPEKSELVSQYLTKEGYSQEQLVASGIFYVNNNNQLVDRFRGRLMIPLRNAQGKTIAFSGRILNNQKKDQAKYLNSPETEIFKKGNYLFNLDKARLPIRQKKFALIAEGYMDVIALYNSGFENVVASMGTSLTDGHFKQLKRHTRQLIFSFDGDGAGQNATQKAFESGLVDRELDLKAITIPQGMDPDDWIQQRGRESYQNLVHRALSYYEFSKEYLKRNYQLGDEGDKAKYLEELIQRIGQIPSMIEQELRIQEIVREFQLNEEIIKEQIARSQSQRDREHQARRQQDQSRQSTTGAGGAVDDSRFMDPDALVGDMGDVGDFGDFGDVEGVGGAVYGGHVGHVSGQQVSISSLAAHESEKLIFYYLMNFESAWDYIDKLSQAPSFYHLHANQAFDILQNHYYGGKRLPLSNYLDTIDDTSVKNYLASVALEYDDISFKDSAMDDCFRRIQREFTRLKINELRLKAQKFEREQDFSNQREILHEIIKLQRQIK